MPTRGGGIAALALAAALCAPGVAAAAPDRWSPEEHRVFLNAPADDPWCVHLRALRAHVSGEGPAPSDEARAAALAEVEAERDAEKAGDPYWPMRKALICEYIDAAAEERAEFDWISAEQFLTRARRAASNPPPENGISPIVQVYDHLRGYEPDSLVPVDLTNDAYCDALEPSDRALSQLRGELRFELGFLGSLQRAPDWFGLTQVAYHRWAREVVEGHQLYEGDRDFGGIPYQCRRFFNAYEGAKSFAVKGNLIFLLPERDDPDKAGRLEIRDADGKVTVIDGVLEAVQFNDDGTGGEAIAFFAEDLEASPGLVGAVNRLNELPPPVAYSIFFDSNATRPIEGDPGIDALTAELQRRNAEEPLRIFITGHADCVGSTAANRQISARRARAVLDTIIKPVLSARGFTEDDFRDDSKFRSSPRGEPRLRAGQRCEADQQERRVTVLVQ